MNLYVLDAKVKANIVIGSGGGSAPPPPCRRLGKVLGPIYGLWANRNSYLKYMVKSLIYLNRKYTTYGNFPHF